MQKNSWIRPSVPALLGGILLLSTPATAAEEAAASLGLKAGKWELSKITSTSGKTHTESVCLKDGDPLPHIVGKSCTVDERSISDDRLNWTASCPPSKKDPNIKSSAHGYISGKDGAFEGESTIELTVGDKKIPATWKWTGKHLGECDAEKPAAKPAAKKQNKQN